LDVRLDHFHANSLTSYFPYQKVSNTNSRLRFIDERGRFLQAGLILKYNIVPNQPVDIASRTQDYSFGAGLLSPYLDFVGKITYDGATPEETDRFNDRLSHLADRVRSYSYIAQVRPPGDCLALRFVFEQVAGGENSFYMTMHFSFDGKSPPPLTIQDLDSIGI
jgi:LPS-assembly protein